MPPNDTLRLESNYIQRLLQVAARSIQDPSLDFCISDLHRDAYLTDRSLRLGYRTLMLRSLEHVSLT